MILLTWTPREKQRQILKTAMDDLQKVQYKVSLRWIFYRLLQKGFYQNKSDYSNKMKDLFRKARKNFYGRWKPDTLTDDTRKPLYYGIGTLNKDEIQLEPSLPWDKLQYQNTISIILYEAKAMTPQFQYYTNDIPLYPFGGDPSIPYKWTIAKDIEEFSSKYDKPITILYYGDYDEKGLQILESAMDDIRNWCSVEFTIKRIGLTLEQAKKYNLPENPEKPNQYQWEALNDEQAKEIIETSIEKYQDKELRKKAYYKEQEIYKDLMKNHQEND